jgi:WD40 repeat protein
MVRVSNYGILKNKKFKLIGKHNSSVNSVDISKNSLKIASGSCDGTLRIWDFNTF